MLAHVTSSAASPAALLPSCTVTVGLSAVNTLRITVRFKAVTFERRYKGASKHSHSLISFLRFAPGPLGSYYY